LRKPGQRSSSCGSAHSRKVVQSMSVKGVQAQHHP
jgi:hypothetical protein